MAKEVIPQGALALAYLGDAVIELMVRKRLTATGISDVGVLNKMSRAYVQACAQSAAVERIMPHLTEEETDAYKRGRNTHTSSHPKSSSVSDYRRATGFEALMGWLYANGRTERAEEIFEAAYPREETEEKAPGGNAVFKA